MWKLENFITDSSINTPIYIFIINQIISLFLALIVSYIYTLFGKSLSNRKEFSNIFVLLSMTTMLIITIVKSSLALSLGLVGALSIVRFRTAIKEPEELSYAFLSIAIGLGLGANQRLTTIIGTLLILTLVVIRSKFSKKNRENYMNLIITSSNNNDLDLDEVVSEISKFSNSVRLKRLSENKDFLESSLTINIESFDKLIKIRNSLKINYPNLTINFLDDSGILNN